MPYFEAIAAHPSLATTLWKASQFLTMPSWIGVGVAMPLVGDGVVLLLETGVEDVGEGPTPIMETQT